MFSGTTPSELLVDLGSYAICYAVAVHSGPLCRRFERADGVVEEPRLWLCGFASAFSHIASAGRGVKVRALGRVSLGPVRSYFGGLHSWRLIAAIEGVPRLRFSGQSIEPDRLDGRRWDDKVGCI